MSWLIANFTSYITGREGAHPYKSNQSDWVFCAPSRGMMEPNGKTSCSRIRQLVDDRVLCSFRCNSVPRSPNRFDQIPSFVCFASQWQKYCQLTRLSRAGRAMRARTLSERPLSTRLRFLHEDRKRANGQAMLAPALPRVGCALLIM